MQFDPEMQAFFDGLLPEAKAAIVMMLSLAEHPAFAGDDAPNVSPDLVIKGCAVLTAAVIEAMPATATTRGLREMTDRAADTLKKAAREMRQTFDETGQRGLQQLGIDFHWGRPD